jgi:hypothetical protein
LPVAVNADHDDLHGIAEPPEGGWIG